MNTQFSYALFLSLLLNLNIFSMEESSTNNSQNNKREKIFDSFVKQMEHDKPLHENEDKDDIFVDVNVKQFECTPSAAEKKLFDKLVKNSPAKVKSTIDIEKEFDPKLVTTRLNYLLMVGKPGIGKSLLAKAVACELGRCYFIISGNFLSKYRHATSSRLISIINSILKMPGKSVLVIDEINKLLENYSSDNNDSGDTASTLWEKIDENELNPNFFLIGTANDSKKIPPQLQTRFRHTFVTITFSSKQDRKELFIHFLHSFNVTVDSKLDDKNIEKLVDKTTDFTARDIKNLCAAALKFAHEKKPVVITMECLEKSLKERENDDKEFINLAPEMSDEERRHKENQESHRQQRNENRFFNVAGWIASFLIKKYA